METDMTTHQIDTEALNCWIGRVTDERRLELVSASDIRRYVDATDDANPLWLDDEFARSQGYRGRLLPPSLIAWEPFSRWTGSDNTDYHGDDLLKQIPFPQSYTDMRNAGSEIEWLRPVALGEALSIQSRIVDIVVRQGRAGLGIYVTREERVVDSDKKPVLLRRQTTVHLPRVAVADRALDQMK